MHPGNYWQGKRYWVVCKYRQVHSASVHERYAKRRAKQLNGTHPELKFHVVDRGPTYRWVPT